MIVRDINGDRSGIQHDALLPIAHYPSCAGDDLATEVGTNDEAVSG
ncbi:MAG: hypothetical protein IPK79_00890 [Vampirovibrionales bacterium]|nr:hypothetical protein [Vampirovibrionales bacterium]